VGKRRYYADAFKTKIIQSALKYRQFCSFKVVHAGIILYRHSGMATQFLVCFPIMEAVMIKQTFKGKQVVHLSFMFNLDR
jgi:hypothetical protein